MLLNAKDINAVGDWRLSALLRLEASTAKRLATNEGRETIIKSGTKK